ncbi:MAG: lipoyl synthase [Candidatus Hydrogenedens sp.]
MDCKTYTKKSFPKWIRFRVPDTNGIKQVSSLLEELGISTVCKSALCPNRAECWSRKTATFLLLGDICSRRCSFCAVKKGQPLSPDPFEKDKILKAVEVMGLQYIILTMVTRDDLLDGGANHIFEIVSSLKKVFPKRKVEVLVSDFQGNMSSLETILKANPDVFSHNLETVERLHPIVRDKKCSYQVSLSVLNKVKEISRVTKTKSGIMVGLSETQDEVLQTLKDLDSVGCSIVTIGQYLQPTPRQLPVSNFISPDEFRFYEEWAGKNLSLKVIAGPEVRSSYHADFWCKEQEE